MRTLLELVNDVLLETGLKSTGQVVNSTESNVRQIYALINRIADHIFTEYDWQFLVKEHRFTTEFYQYTGTTVDGASAITSLSSVANLSSDFMVSGPFLQDTFITDVGTSSVICNTPATRSATGETITFGRAMYDMPSDYERIVNKSEYNKTNRWAVIGPKSPQEWQWLKASYISTGPRMRFRIVNNKFAVWPMPTSEVLLGFEYISNGYVVHETGGNTNRFTVDTDTCLFPDRLMVIGARMLFRQAKELDATADVAAFNRELSKFKSQNAGADTLSMVPRSSGILITSDNIPDSNYGAVTG